MVCAQIDSTFRESFRLSRQFTQQQIFHQRFLRMQSILATATATRFNQRLGWCILPA
jgi:hypothetical protein